MFILTIIPATRMVVSITYNLKSDDESIELTAAVSAVLAAMLITAGLAAGILVPMALVAFVLAIILNIPYADKLVKEKQATD
jgi:hypothetical protein